MTQYIDKDKIVAEIERRKEKCDTFYNIALSNNVELAKVAIEEQKRQYNSLLSFLDTLEVKEVDLDEESDNQWGALSSDVRNSIYYNDYYKIAKHFFEVGMAVSNKA